MLSEEHEFFEERYLRQWRASGGYIQCTYGKRCYRATYADLGHPETANKAANMHTRAFGKNHKVVHRNKNGELK